MMYTCGYTFFHSFSLQAIYRLSRVIYPMHSKRQHYSLYIIMSFGQWIFSALELLPSLCIGDIEYLPNDYHCQVALTSMRGSLTVCLLGFLCPYIITVYCYIHTMCYVRRRTLTVLIFQQRSSVRRNLIILRRLVILLTCVISTAAPHGILPIVYSILGELPRWLVPLEWVLTIFALVTISVAILFVSPLVKKLCI
ncbi:unnamed protein product [Adineta steineri]|uniref:G-protein coupled receptors family 1 profile domain-containing protein n=1 Tax=Adineta steineri TaxID=433720 RepID=A0A819DF53_9BILA|nr:unnamed protein product [Adineta steineri]CAF3822784.1 unnamed protein product [Adineta steineri]